MTRAVLTTGALAAILLSAPAVIAFGAEASVTSQAAAQVTPAEAAAFIGDWTLALQGPDGPGTFELSLTVEKEKVIGEISSEQVANQPISTIHPVRGSTAVPLTHISASGRSFTPDQSR